MNPRDALSENDYYDPRDLAPVYYCENEHCGKELGYPPPFGLCWDCELKTEQPYEDSDE